MQVPVQIAFHGLDKSDAIEEKIRERVAKLEHFFDRITACRVVVETHHRSHSNLNKNDQPFHISIQLSVPGEELVVRRDPKETKVHEDINVALRDAFDTMERRLRDFTTRLKDVHRGDQAHGSTA